MLNFMSRPVRRTVSLFDREWPRATAVLLSLFVVATCSNTDDGEYVERPVNEIYNEATAALADGLHKSAAALFDEVERQHPYSKWATQAQLMAAYSYYYGNDYDDALVALDRFIQLHPSHKDIPYAYYLKGLSYYEQISDISRDQRMTELALKSLNELLARFPESRYSRDAKVKIDLTRDHLAGKDMEIGRYYLSQKYYAAAINRFLIVVERYETTTHVPEALHRLAESYHALGLEEDAKKAAAVLGHNFPGSEWYIDSFEMIEGQAVRAGEEESWYQFW
jgi:outer membrane protein assembly factor BamD